MVLLVTLLAALAACSGQQPTTSSPDTPYAAVDGAADGHDMAEMTGTDDLPAPPESADWNAADATYLTRMIGHHRQALDLADLAETRAEDPRVRAIARSIDSGQSREIIVMATWLVDHGLPEPTLEDVEAMAGMAGMVSPDQLADLAAAEGEAFDRLFLQSMIAHHRGALGMAEEQLSSGEDLRVVEMATEVVASQAGEIRRMEDLLGVA